MRRDRAFYADIARRYWALTLERDREGLLALFHEDAVMHIILAPEPVIGHPGLRGFFDKLFDNHATIRVEVLRILVDPEAQAAVTEQRVELVDHEGKLTVFPRNTNHFYFEGERIRLTHVFRSES
jgi:ketosteroid isomerase-like protein